MIPCPVVEADELDCYLITLAENIARRRHSTVELMAGLQVLRDKGYSTEEIARKRALTPLTSTASCNCSTRASNDSFRPLRGG
jgi:ParB-like chromosome segregation protein Spo0J